MEADILVSNAIDGETVTVRCAGTYAFDGRVAVMEYDEPDGSGLDGTRVRIIADGHGVTVERSGAVEMLMRIEPECRTSGKLITPYGELPLMVEAGDVTALITLEYARIDAAYRLEIGGRGETEQECRINITANI